MNKKGIIIGIICVVLIVSGIMFYYTSDIMKLARDGYRVDWDDPWALNGTIYYFCEYKNNDGQLIQQWMTINECYRIIEMKHKGKL